MGEAVTVMDNTFENKREVLAHLAEGGKIRIITTGDVIYMTSDGVFLTVGGKGAVNYHQLFYNEVERYVEPNKYSLEVWFTEHPHPVFFNDGKSAYLFGRDISWNSSSSGEHSKKYRITVEEVIE
jgi:hypothetical protein